MTEIKYPDQIRVIKRKNKNISVRFALGRYSEESGESPLDMPGYSRFIMSILKTEGGVQATTANIPQEELPNISIRTQNAVRMMMERIWIPKSTTSVVAPVNTSKESKPEQIIPEDLYHITFGFPIEIRGKNVVQAYREGFWEKVVGQKDILRRNADKYPSNSKLVDAIERMETLVRSGVLDSESAMDVEPETTVPAESGLVIPIYETETKFFSKKREDGKNKTYQISIVCLPDNKYPFKVTMVNGFADVVTTAFGGKNITNITDKTYLDIYLTEAEWSNMVDRMMEISRNYEMLESKSRFELMKKHAYQSKYQQ